MLIICANPDYTKFSMRHLYREMPFGRKKCLYVSPVSRVSQLSFFADWHMACTLQSLDCRRCCEPLPSKRRIAHQQAKKQAQTSKANSLQKWGTFSVLLSSLNSHFDSPDLLCLMTFRDLALSVKKPSHLFAELPLVR